MTKQGEVYAVQCRNGLHLLKVNALFDEQRIYANVSDMHIESPLDIRTYLIPDVQLSQMRKATADEQRLFRQSLRQLRERSPLAA